MYVCFGYMLMYVYSSNALKCVLRAYVLSIMAMLSVHVTAFDCNNILPKGYKKFMLSSAEHEIFNGH